MHTLNTARLPAAGTIRGGSFISLVLARIPVLRWLLVAEPPGV